MTLHRYSHLTLGPAPKETPKEEPAWHRPRRKTAPPRECHLTHEEQRELAAENVRRCRVFAEEQARIEAHRVRRKSRRLKAKWKKIRPRQSETACALLGGRG
jgi:transposase